MSTSVQIFSKANISAFDQLAVCFGSFEYIFAIITIFAGSKRRRTLFCLGCHGDGMMLQFIGSTSDSRFRRRGYF